MSQKDNEVTKSLAALAVQIAQECLDRPVITGGEGPAEPMLSFDQKVNAFKALVAYELGLRKAKMKAPDGDEEEDEDGETPNFNTFARNLREVK